MLAPSERRPTFRVLCLYPHPRLSGHAVLDDHGLVRSATFVMRTRRFPSLEERIASIEERLRDSVRTFRPDVVVVLLVSDHGDATVIHDRVLAVTDALPVHATTLETAAVEELFATPGGSLCDQLGQAVTSSFFPELVHRTGAWRSRGDHVRRAVRPVWKATAGAIAVLAEHRPDAVIALARGPVPPGLASLIERASGASAP